jgi:hypothetical protein
VPVRGSATFLSVSLLLLAASELKPAIATSAPLGSSISMSTGVSVGAVGAIKPDNSPPLRATNSISSISPPTEMSPTALNLVGGLPVTDTV